MEKLTGKLINPFNHNHNRHATYYYLPHFLAIFSDLCHIQNSTFFRWLQRGKKLIHSFNID